MSWGGGWNGMLWVGDDFFISHGQEGGGGRELVLGKHPDLMVGPPTATVFPTNDRKFEIYHNFSQKISKRFKPKHRPKGRHLVETVKRS